MKHLVLVLLSAVLMLLASYTGAVAKIRVVTTIPDLADMAKNIGGDLLEIKSLATGVEDIHAVLADLEPLGVQPEKPPYHPGDREELPLIAFVADPDGYRIELIDGGAFATPQDEAG